MKCRKDNAEMIKEGIYTNKKGKFQRWKCNGCGGHQVDLAHPLIITTINLITSEK